MDSIKVAQYKVINQFLLETNKQFIFQSYASTICKIDKNKTDNFYNIYFYRHYDYSKTTTKYLLQFLKDFEYNIYNYINNQNETPKKVIYNLINNKYITINNVNYKINYIDKIN